MFDPFNIYKDKKNNLICYLRFYVGIVMGTKMLDRFHGSYILEQKIRLIRPNINEAKH